LLHRAAGRFRSESDSGWRYPNWSSFRQGAPQIGGIHWAHVNGRSAAAYLPETTGAGCAFLDYDNDGWMDIYLVNSGRCDFYNPDPPLRNALYRNNRDGTFTDVTQKAGVSGGGYGMGAAVADYDGDGFPDLYVTQYGRPNEPVSRLRGGPPARYGSTTTMTGAWIFLSAASSISAKSKTCFAEIRRRGKAPIAFLASTSPCRVGSFTTTEMALSPM
jgi:hypothetical protein